MKGQVQGHQALMKVGFHLEDGRTLDIEFVVDTGFVGYLTLPQRAIVMLDLPFLRRTPANLADGSTIHVSVYAATIVWEGQVKEAEVLSTGQRPLMGTLLLNGHHLSVHFVNGGEVVAESL